MSAEKSHLFLASGSPRRREMLRELRLSFDASALHIDESIREGESALDYVRRVTLEKLQAGEAHVKTNTSSADGVLAADTVVVLDGLVLGKPKNRDESQCMVTRLAGRSHQVMTSYGLVRLHDGVRISRTVSTDVTFRSATAAEISGYVATGEGDDKAGAYAIQGIGAFLVSSISGSYSNVVGLPICELIVDLKALGFLREYP